MHRDIMSPMRNSRSDKAPAAYLRLSVTNDDSVSIEAQRDLVTTECRRRGWADPVIFVDEGISGSKDVKRPARDEMERRLSSGEFSALIAKSVDRLARSSADFARLAKVCKDTSTALVVTDLNVDSSTPAGAMVLGVLAQMAEFEAALIGSRVKQANAEKVKQGRALAGPVPWHLVNVPRDGGGMRRAMVAERAAIVREMVDRLISGESLRAIAVDLNERGIPAPRGGTAWASTTVKQIVANPAIAGMTRRLGDVVRDEDGLPRVDVATAAIDLSTWTRLSAVLGERGTAFKPRTKVADRLLLDGVAVCALCGGRMRHQMTNKGRSVNYSCSNSARGTCPGASISAPVLDAHVIDEYLSTFGIFRAVEVTTGEDPVITEARALVAMEERTTREALLTADVEDIAGLAERLRMLAERRAEHDAAQPLLIERDLGMTVAQRWEAADDDERRGLLGDALDTVRVARGRSTGRVEVVWRGQSHSAA